MQSIFKTFGNIVIRYQRKQYFSPGACSLKCETLPRVPVPAILFSTSSSPEQHAKESTTESENNSLTPEESKKRKIIEVEMEMMRQAGEHLVPDKVTEVDWTELLSITSSSLRRKYFKYMKKRELSIASRAAKAEENRQIRQEKYEADKKNNHLVYGLGRNSIFFYVRESTMVKYYNNNLAHAVQFGQNIVFDMDYYRHMSPHEIKNCVNQLKDCYGFNKLDKDPFHIHFCNVKPEESLTKKLYLGVPPLAKPKSLITMSEKCYLDLFPREKLVYLTPDCREDLTRYNHDDIYIIGCLVDRGPSKPLSLAKAKRQGLRMAKLPLDRHLDWGCGHKSLTLDQVLKILLKMKNTGDWEAAFEHVPKRKLRRETKDKI